MRPVPSKDEGKLLAKVAVVANIVLAGAGALCLLAWLYVSYHYGWSEERQFASWTGLLVYWVAPAVLAILLFGSLWLRASHKINIALVVCSLGATIYALETGLTLWLSLPSVMFDEDRRVRAAAAKAIGSEFDTRTRLEVVQSLVSQGADAIPFLSPRSLLKERADGTLESHIRVNGMEVLPLGAIAHKLVVLCNETGQFVIFRSDGYGFNNPLELWEKVPPDIAVLGDSFVQGYCVDENFIAIMRKQYPATLNLGGAGNGPLIMLATLKEYAWTVKPKVVLWCYFEGNDLRDLAWEANSQLLRRYLTPGFRQDLIGAQAGVNRALVDYLETVKGRSTVSIKLEEMWELLGELREGDNVRSKIKSIGKLAAIRRKLGLVYGTGNPDADVAPPMRQTATTSTELFFEILVEARRSVNEWGGRLYFVYLPGWDSYVAKGARANPFRAQVLLTAKRAGLPVIDIHQVFDRQPDTLALFPFRMKGHYVEEGNKLVAAEILRSIAVGQ